MNAAGSSYRSLKSREGGLSWGAFGLAMEDGTARQGQGWLAGSDREFLPLTRAQLEWRCPVHEPDSVAWDRGLGSPGVVYLLGERESWTAVHAFWPQFSAARHVPMWACIRMDALRFSEGMLLPSVMRSFLQLRRDMALASCGAEGWLAGRCLDSGPPPGIVDFRALCALARREQGRAFDISQDILWRGAQLQMEAVGERFGREHVAMQVAIDGASAQHLPDLARDCVWSLSASTRRSESPDIAPVMCSGVVDEELASRLGIRGLVRSGVRPDTANPSGRLEDRVSVPIELRAIANVTPEDAPEWATALWSAGSAVSRTRELRLHLASSAPGGSRALLLAHLLAASEPAIRGDISGVYAVLREAGFVPIRVE